MPDTLVEFVLARLDETEEPVILHNEVAGYGRKLQVLLAQGILRSTSDATEVPRPASMQPGDDLIVRKTAAGIFGVAPEDDYFDPVPLTEEDVRQYEINLSKLAFRLRKENGIQGNGAENDDGLLWLGEKALPQGGTADVYLCFPNYDEDEFWDRCGRLKRSRGKQTIMVLTPRPVRLTPERKRVLDSESIVITSLARSPAGLPEGEMSSVAVLQEVALGQLPLDGKEVPWNPSDPDYIPAKDAVAYVKEIDGDFDYGALNKLLTPDGPMWFMRNPNNSARGPGSVRCKVHEGDLKTWRDGLGRTPAAKARPGRGRPAKPVRSDDGLYDKGFAEGEQEGYRQGYTEVKERKPYSCVPPPQLQDDPDDQYLHGLCEGWKAGYSEGRRDSEHGKPQKRGARE